MVNDLVVSVPSQFPASSLGLAQHGSLSVPWEILCPSPPWQTQFLISVTSQFFGNSLGLAGRRQVKPFPRLQLHGSALVAPIFTSPLQGKPISLLQFLSSSWVVPRDFFNKVNPFPCSSSFQVPWQFLPQEFLGPSPRRRTQFLPCFSSFPVPSLFQFLPNSLVVPWDLFNKVNPVPCFSSFPVTQQFLGPSSRR